MDKASINSVIYDYVLNFLIDGFDKLKFESVLVHIANNYVEGGCETNSKKLMQKRLEGYQKMAIGKKVPDIIMLNENGKQFRLYELKNDYILVLFWASWCPHCTNMIPQLKKWYLTKSINLQVYAVSIDSSRFAWEENLMMNNYSWINTCTFAGWNDKAAKDYNLYATPTMFLLDREHKIIAKPMTFREFRKEVDKL
jgi:peroxiredoxin